MHVEYNKCDLSVKKCLTLSWRRPLSYRNQSIDKQSMDCFLYDNGLRHERVNVNLRVWICYREFYDWNEMNLITQIIKFSIKDFFSKCNQIRSFLNPREVSAIDFSYSKVPVYWGSFLIDFCPSLHKKWSFPLRIYSVNVTKSAGNWNP